MPLSVATRLLLCPARWSLQVSMLVCYVHTILIDNENNYVAVVSSDYFSSRVSLFFQLSWNSHTGAVSVVGFTLISLGLTCMLRVCLYRKAKGAMEGEKRGVRNISFRWWRKPEYKCPERTTGQPQVTDNLLTYG